MRADIAGASVHQDHVRPLSVFVQSDPVAARPRGGYGRPSNSPLPGVQCNSPEGLPPPPRAQPITVSELARGPQRRVEQRVRRGQGTSVDFTPKNWGRFAGLTKGPGGGACGGRAKRVAASLVRPNEFIRAARWLGSPRTQIAFLAGASTMPRASAREPR